MGELMLRLARPGDDEALIDLLWALNRFENAISGDRATDRAAAAATLKANRDGIAAQGGCEIVATDDDRAVGYLALCFPLAPPFVRADIRRRGYILDLVVAESHRGRGLGTALLAEAEETAREAGVSHIGVGVLAGNDRARRLYEQVGFRAEAIEMTKPLRETTGD